MHARHGFAIALASLLAANAWAQSPAQRDAQDLARFQGHASPPQKSMHFFKMDGFQYLGKDAQKQDVVAVWTGVNQVYMLTLQSPCINVDLAFAVSLTNTMGDVNAGMDYVKYNHNGPQQCRIQTIQKVDYKAVRAEQAAAKKAPAQASSAGGT